MRCWDVGALVQGTYQRSTALELPGRQEEARRGSQGGMARAATES